MLAAEVIVGSQRQLALLPPGAATHRPWPSPIDTLVDELCNGVADADLRARERRPDAARDRRDARRGGSGRGACGSIPTSRPSRSPARAWAGPTADVELVSAVGRPPEVLARSLQPGRRIVAYVSGSRWGERRGARAARARLRSQPHGRARAARRRRRARHARALPRSGASVRSASSTASRWIAARTREPRGCRARRDCRTTPTSTTASSPSGPSAP